MTSLKSLSALLMIFCLFYACKKDTSQQSALPESSDIETDAAAIDGRESTILKTSTGKSIEVVTLQKSSSINDILIIAKDFPQTRDTFYLEEVDPLQDILIGDLDKNGFDEIYLITTSSGSGSYSTIHGFASNQDLSMTPIYLPEVSENDMLPEGDFYGYMGHDSIYMVNNRIQRKFPVYKEGDPNCCPTGGDKVLAYQLKPGEAAWQLRIEK